MGIDDPKCGRLCAQMNENTHQYRVLEDIGKIARMKGVAVVHDLREMRRGR